MRALNPKIKISLVGLAVIAALSGCTLKDIDNLNKKASRNGDQSESIIKGQQSKTQPSVQWVDKPFVNLKPIPQVSMSLNADKDVPACNITLNAPSGLSLYDLSQRITRWCGIPVNIAPDALGAVSGVVSSASPTKVVAGSLPVPDDNGRVPLGAMGGMQASQSVAVQSEPVRSLGGLRYQGDLHGLLDTVAGQLGISWKKTQGQISFFRYETRMYQLAVLDAKTAMQSSILSGSTSSMGASGGTSGSSISGDGSTSQKTTVEMQSDLYSDIENTIKSMLTPVSGRYFLSAGSGSLTVTDTPDVLNQIAEYVNRQNAILNRQVLLNVEVLSVSRKDNHQMGIDWTAVYRDLNSVGATLTGSFANAASNVISSGVNVLDSNSKLSGSSVLIKALEEQGNVSVVTTHSGTTTNLVPLPVQVAEQTAYIASTSTTTTANVGESTSFTPGLITTGFNMTMLPYIKDNSEIQLQFSINLSDPPTIRSVTSRDGNATIEMPYTKLRSLSQRVNLRAGQTLILSGFEQMNTTVNKQGTFTPGNFLFGGGQDGKDEKSTLVVLVTPILQ